LKNEIASNLKDSAQQRKQLLESKENQQKNHQIKDKYLKIYRSPKTKHQKKN
jgi:hypothetical protein